MRRFVTSIITAALLVESGASQAAPPAPAPVSDSWVGRDKALHFGVSAAIASGSYGLASLVSNDLRLRMVFGGGMGIAAGAGKELLDLAGYGDPSWKDFAWDVVGTLVGIGISVSIDFALHAAHHSTMGPRAAPNPARAWLAQTRPAKVTAP